ncbi:White-brown complex protein 11 [Cinnamomum micranthum f. kanehirae]|uniref:White-brown complex protein 11 n=1 Tax=Cinnamomum micranthum f. kanehirae TaxID=337451 RepID=A0A443Q4L5_9MAGN|nr:White-brown complex protein 11 [Cinnamomum micranthum f. kanehirae]
MAKQYQEMSSFDSQEDLSYGEEGFFPFSTASKPHHSTPHPSAITSAAAAAAASKAGSSPSNVSFEAPSLLVAPEINSSRAVETVMSNQEEGRRVLTRAPVEGGLNHDGVFLTWEDLRVTASSGKGGSLPILQGLTGYAQLSEFFAVNGFPCPSLRNPSDHYLRTINKDFDQDIEKGHGVIPTAEAIDILVKSYKSSTTYQQVSRRVVEICKTEGGALDKKGSQASFLTQSLVLTRRSYVNMYRDLGYYWLRLAIYIALCLCVGTIYHDIGKSYGSIQARGSMLMFVAAFLTFMAIGGFPSFVEDMKIFGRERLNGHYGVAAFVVGNTFSSIPYLLLISVVPGAIAYYLVGLQRGIDHFVYFALVLFVCMMLVESLMMIVASIVPDFLMGIITGAGIQGVMMLNGGFFRLPDDLPKPFWRYPMYYIAFHKYANQGFYKNEFIGLTFPNNQAGGPPTITGKEILRNTWQVEMGHSKWVDLAILFGMVITYRVMFLGIIKVIEKVKPMIRSLLTVPPEKSPLVVGAPSVEAAA